MSKLTVSTTQLQALVGKASQGVGDNKLHRLTTMIGIQVADNVLHLYTTDGVNDLCVSCEVSDGKAFLVTVNADTFIKLINKITSDTVTLEAGDSSLKIIGNGVYQLPLETDDEGNIFSYPVDKFASDGEELGTLHQSAIQTMQLSLKSSLSPSVGSVYTNYYAGEFICATDRAMMGLYEYKAFNEGGKSMLFNSQFVDLLPIANEDVALSIDGNTNTLIAEAANFKLITKAVTDCADFNVDGIKKMQLIPQDSYCRLRKKDIISLLDRLSLFVGPYDDGAVILHFGDDAVEVSSVSSSGVETVYYTESKNIVDKTIKINIVRLISQLKSYASDTVDLYYGSDVCIKLADGDVIQVIALMK